MVFAVDINVSSSAAGDSLVDGSCSDWIVIILMQDGAIKQLPRSQYNLDCVFNQEYYGPKVIFSRCPIGQELWDKITVRMMEGNGKRKNHPACCGWTPRREKKQKEKQKEEDWNRSSSRLALDSEPQYSTCKIQQKTWQQNETVHHSLNWIPVLLNWLIISLPAFRHGKILIIELENKDIAQNLRAEVAQQAWGSTPTLASLWGCSQTAQRWAKCQCHYSNLMHSHRQC